MGPRQPAGLGESASRCSGGCPRAPTATAGSRRWRTTASTSGAGCCRGWARDASRWTERFDTIVVGLGALGSATAWDLARRGRSVLGLERFELGHSRGASHDTSRILRHSYHTPSYVRLTQEAYVDWARLEQDSGEELVTTVGGLDLFPPDSAISPVDYTESLDEVGIAYDVLDAAAVHERWPQFRLPEGTLVLHQADAAIVPAARGTRVMQEQARRHGADLRDHVPVLSVRDLGDRVEVTFESPTEAAQSWPLRRGHRGRLDQRRAAAPRTSRSRSR